jgi:hypothetical protein
MPSEELLAPPRVAPKASAPATTGGPGWLQVAGLGKPQAEQLLDWLEVNGFEQRQVVLGPDGSFVVRYRPRSPRGPL